MKILLIIILYFSFALAYTDKYNRKDYGGWIDADRDRQNTRTEVLIEENLSPYMILSKNKKKVLSGMWVCFYSGDTITEPSKLDIDHVVPLKEAHRSGAWKWPKSKKKRYANYLKDKKHLRAVTASENRSKGARDPCKYMPKINKCLYLKEWVNIKRDWNLIMDHEENVCINKLKLKYCN